LPALLAVVTGFFCTDSTRGLAAQVFDALVSSNLGDVTKLLLGDLQFARQVCESAYVVSQYEALHTTDLLSRLSLAGFRAVHIQDPALRKPRSGRGLAKQYSVRAVGRYNQINLMI
jgi:hypothetical protein